MDGVKNTSAMSQRKRTVTLQHVSSTSKLNNTSFLLKPIDAQFSDKLILEDVSESECHSRQKPETVNAKLSKDLLEGP